MNSLILGRTAKRSFYKKCKSNYKLVEIHLWENTFFSPSEAFEEVLKMSFLVGTENYWIKE